MTATPDSVDQYLRGQGFSKPLYQGAKKFETWIRQVSIGDMRDLLGELTWNLLRHHDQFDSGREGVPQPGEANKTTMGLWDGVKRVVWEVTLWLPFRPLTQLRKRKADTMLGHATNAASAGLLSLEVSLRIAKALQAKGFDVDLSGIDGLDAR